jgi:2',3'-cyclic-nucleotide 2'-phosphodiesterase (5'-nucleotidase family)
MPVEALCEGWFSEAGGEDKGEGETMKKIAISISLFCLLLSGYARAEKKIVILYTNDMMGHLKGEPAYFINRDFPPPLGNAASCATYVKEARRDAEKDGSVVLLLDAGNCFGNPVLGKSDLGKTIDFMNILSYDAVSLGIYDVRFGEDVVWDIIDKTEFPWLSANLTWQSSSEYVTDRYRIFDLEGITIGIFGLISEYGPIWVESKIDEQFHFEKEGPRTFEVVSLLKEEGCDFIVGLTNTGFIHDSLLADSVPGIDVIIGGGEGRGMREPYESARNHTIICRTYGNLSSIGRLEVFVDEQTKTITRYRGSNITLFEEQFPPDPSILRLLAE